jgi:hypothetical protein
MKTQTREAEMEKPKEKICVECSEKKAAKQIIIMLHKYGRVEDDGRISYILSTIRVIHDLAAKIIKEAKGG